MKEGRQITREELLWAVEVVSVLAVIGFILAATIMGESFPYSAWYFMLVPGLTAIIAAGLLVFDSFANTIAELTAARLAEQCKEGKKGDK